MTFRISSPTRPLAAALLAMGLAACAESMVNSSAPPMGDLAASHPGTAPNHARAERYQADCQADALKLAAAIERRRRGASKFDEQVRNARIFEDEIRKHIAAESNKSPEARRPVHVEIIEIDAILKRHQHMRTAIEWIYDIPAENLWEKRSRAWVMATILPKVERPYLAACHALQDTALRYIAIENARWAPDAANASGGER